MLDFTKAVKSVKKSVSISVLSAVGIGTLSAAKVCVLSLITILFAILTATTAYAIPLYSFGANTATQSVYIRIRAEPGELQSNAQSFYIGTRTDRGSLLGNTATPYHEGDFIGILHVPRFGRTVNVYEGETLQNMDKGAGRFTFSGLNFGNTALIGHNRGRTNGFFSFVRLLEVGDMLRLETAKMVREYVVVNMKIVLETDFSWAVDFGDNRLTLVTCVEYQRDYRRIVYAVEVR